MRAPHRPPEGGALAATRITVSLAALLGLASCGLNQEGVPPPLDRIAFPASIKADPTGQWLYVVNSNADLRYNSGTLVVVDLDEAAKDRGTAWTVCPRADFVPPPGGPKHFCCWDYLDHNILDCDDRQYIRPETTAEIGSFGAGMALQTFADPAADCEPSKKMQRDMTPQNRHDCSPACGLDPRAGRLYIGVRGNSSLTYVDTAPEPDAEGHPVLSCPKSTTPHSTKECSIKEIMDDHAPQPTVVPDEPYALLLDPSRDLLYVGHLRGDVLHPGTGGISLFDIQKASEGLPPTFLKPSGAIFGADGNGNFGVTSLTTYSDKLYATSRFSTSATRVALQTPQFAEAICSQDPGELNIVASGETYTSPLLGSEIRGIQFLPRRPTTTPTPGRAFMLQRTPPAVVSFDSDMGETRGVFGNFATDVIETCQAPTFLQKDRTEAEEAAGADDAQLYVTCFESGQVYVIDPRVPRLVSVIDVGRGPAGLEFVNHTDATGHEQRLAYVVGFGSNNLAVVDLTPGSQTLYHVIQRLGFPSVVPR